MKKPRGKGIGIRWGRRIGGRTRRPLSQGETLWRRDSNEEVSIWVGIGYNGEINVSRPLKV